MGNQYKKKTTPEQETKVIELWSAGEVAKRIAFITDVPLSMVYLLKERFPLLCWNDQENEE